MHLKQFSNKSTNPIISKLLTNFVGYYDGNHFQFALVNERLTLVPAAPNQKPNKKPKILIVAPSLYQEKAIDIPVENKGELRKLLKLQLADDEYAIVQSIEDGKSKVNSWFYDENVPEAWLRIPESLLLGMLCENGEAYKITDSNDNVCFVSQFEKVIYSTTRHGLINDTNRFAISAGIPIEHTYELSFEDKAQVLSNTISKLKPEYIFALIKKLKKADLKDLLAQIFIPTLSIASLYLLLTSVYLVLNIAYAENKLANQSSEVAELLTKQDSLEANRQEFQQLAAFLETKQNNAGLWLVLAPLFEISVIKTVKIENNRFHIRGLTEKATTLLEKITSNPNVQSAKFESPVRKSRKFENYRISFALNPQISLEQANKKEAKASE